MTGTNEKPMGVPLPVEKKSTFAPAATRQVRFSDGAEGLLLYCREAALDVALGGIGAPHVHSLVEETLLTLGHHIEYARAQFRRGGARREKVLGADELLCLAEEAAPACG